MDETDKIEKERIKKLRSYDILDTREEAEFDQLVQLAAQICEVPFAKINFLDEARSWSKANYGNDIKETPREVAFCDQTIRNESHMIVEDTLQDERFKHIPYVTNSPNVRFYAGFNIKAEGYNLGTICVLGVEPKKLSGLQLQALETIASEIQSRLELKKKNKDLATISAFLEASVEAMLIVDPANLKIIRKNDSDLLSRLIEPKQSNQLTEIFSNSDYISKLQAWHEDGAEGSCSSETSLTDIKGEKVYLEVNTIQKYGKWMITLQNITKRRLAEDRLIEEKKLSDAIINALPSHFYMFDEGGNFIRWNQNIIDTTGFNENELEQMTPLDFFDGEDVERIQDYFSKTMDGFEGAIQADLVYKNGDTEPFIFHATAFENNGHKYLLGTSQSVAEQVEYQSNLKNLIKEKEVLLQEVHHRVKNNLAVISGFLQLQELISEDEHTKSVLFSNYTRVKSMSLIHEELYKANDFTGIEFDHYLEVMLRDLEEQMNPPEKDVNLKISSDSLYMNLNQAVPLALIINELVSNAYTFAFEGRSSGVIRVQLDVESDKISVVVEDDGIGLPENFKFEESPTLGTTLVMSYSDQLNADVHINSENGTRYKLIFENKKAQTGSSAHAVL
ncbi:MAG: histidine kinase dimerization/phosphoacceptor domain -containing protein [Gracilimonas sp.]|nr:histidine kinase dimerization/phosphoacceptor domain -containing protein [Gracilimonas sp.]